MRIPPIVNSILVGALVTTGTALAAFRLQWAHRSPNFSSLSSDSISPHRVIEVGAPTGTGEVAHLVHCLTSTKEEDLWLDTLTFHPHFKQPVAMWVQETSMHYRFDAEESAAEYAKLLPPGGHTILLRDDYSGLHGEPEVYTVALFHQLKCLDIIRGQISDPSRTLHSLVQHCMNYLRQTLLCYPNLRLEPAIDSAGSAVRGYHTSCRDWTTLYDEAEANHLAYNLNPRHNHSVDIPHSHA